MTDDQQGEDTPQGGGRWNPLPQGDYDDGATAFVQLPEGGIDALLDAAGSPLAAPGHGFVPPQITVTPATGAGTDPAVTGTWTMPQAPADGAQWQAPGSGQPYGGARDPYGTAEQHGTAVQHGPGGTEYPEYAEYPGQVEYPGHVEHVEYAEYAERAAYPERAEYPEYAGHDPYAGAGQDPYAGQGDRFAHHPGATGQWDFGDAVPAGEAPAPGHDVTGQWSIPVAGGELPDESGEFTTSALVEQWGGTPPATLPGGAPAPWATQAAGEPWGEQAERLAERVPEVSEAPVVPAVQDGGRAPFPDVRPYQDPAPAGTATEEAPHGAEEAHGAEEGAESLAEPSAEAASPAVEPEAVPEIVPEAVEEPPADAVSPEPSPEPSPQAGAEVEVASGPEVEVASDPEAETEAEPVPETEAEPVPETEAEPVPETEAEPVPEPESAPDASPPQAPPVPAPAPAHDEHPLASYVLRVNGTDRPVTDAWIGESLLYVLRERLGLAGAKDGCSQGECGACNVQVDGRLVASCLVPGVTAAGSEVRTVEGLAVDGQPSDVQRALARCGAVQCGFCVPGMAMTVHDLLEGNPAPTELETRQALCGNLCRCSGYRGFLRAVEEVVAEREATAEAEADAASGAEAEEPRIPHQAGPGSGGVHASAYDPPHHQPHDYPHDHPHGHPHDQSHNSQDGGHA